MNELPESLKQHRIRTANVASVLLGEVRYSPLKSLWLTGMFLAALIGGVATFSWAAFAVFLLATGTVLLLGHSLGSHRKLIHDSYQCPKWLEYTLVYLGVQVGLAGPLGLLRQHDLRDYAQRLPECHDYLRHGRSFWVDGWWQLHCDLVLDSPPVLELEERIANDRFYQFLERTWMLQQLLPALALFLIGGWGFVFWGVCARITAGVVGHWLIGYFAHNEGEMHYRVNGAAVQGRNIRYTSLLTMGESWHNNHHAFPGSARLGLFPGEWDPGWWVLLLLKKIGLVWNLTEPSDLAIRAELEALDNQRLVGTNQCRREVNKDEPQASLCALLKLSLQARSPTVPLQLEGPAINISGTLLQTLIGSGSRFTHSLNVQRLQLKIGGEQVSGLPALLLALSRRGRVLTGVCTCLMPLAFAFNWIRGELESV
ncbi:acyl-CoA desaturase [Pseudomonas fulva]|uniref:Fatty acid desaturase n=1 Tax=Pseudomonas fulva (strain 12-X) TaxID=743720 RepID=F6AHP3_PSEF1|nr:acyl-CoA desaturase [Pseudomonas fulva]AEF21567.1 fatty acid desaturase [Pseudomonas fulva 12-X]